MRLHGKKILVVDDEKALSGLLGEFLRREGAQVESAEDGAAGFRRAVFSAPDLVIMDLNMPGVNGLEAIRSLRLNNARMPIVVLTGYGSEEHFEAAREAGADLCIAKPPRLETLLQSLVLLLKGKASADDGETSPPGPA
mgnify:CR=1 FL=1